VVLGDDNIPWLRHELAPNLGVPGIPNQDVALGAVGRGDPFANQHEPADLLGKIAALQSQN
jgi:hypothetical protein